VTPRATYRIQLSPSFDFDAAAGLAGYLAPLGISHLYCSPVLQAAVGSSHGYDVVDPARVNSELGGDAAFHRLARTLAEHSLGMVVDIVPNHMATATPANPWWWDLLRKGRASAYADYFDVDWHPASSAVRDKVVLGVLSDRYGHELDTGALTLERHGDGMALRYHDELFPVSPESLQDIDLDHVQEDLDAFDRLLQRQHYRLEYWRSAQEELNYRRFFTVDSLIGLRVERQQVFDDSHRLVLDLVAQGLVDGLRIDHVDGLRDPLGYLRRLRRAAPGAYIVVEKILAPDEELPAAFEVHGTTGYEFIAIADGLCIDPDSEPAMTALYHAFSGETQTYPDVVRTCKLEIMQTELAPDLERLTALLVEICEADRKHRDRTRRELSDAIREVAAAFRVYRTYTSPESPAAEADRREVQLAIDESARRRPDIDPGLLSLIHDLLVTQPATYLHAEFTARFQQFTPAVMAKGVEDTAFYRYHRLVPLNEVGGDPGLFGRPLQRFHDWCGRIAATRPATMLTLTTHDTKRSADVRARLDVLSEIPGEWEAAVRRWAEHNDRYRTQGYPDRNLEYLIYQTLVGGWPLSAERLTQFLQKAAREAKVHTSWVDPVPAYEEAVANFAASISGDAEFTSDLESFLGRNQLVARGRANSLAQTALLLACPGVPDLYQGSEAWNLALVDPDNRTLVDYVTYQNLLTEVGRLDAAGVQARADDGAPKMWLIERVLRERARRPDLFSSGRYTPVFASGQKARHAVCFTRDALLVLVPRLVASLGGDWADTQIELPRGSWTNLLTGQRETGPRPLDVGQILEGFPVAVMIREDA
jgi:(1->4)-alpha-D-glucan 1-alpha-D-glucosylmutase